LTGTTKLPISAFVVTLNEGHLIEECLKSIDFCDEVLVADLGSNDDSVELCLNLGADVVFHERLPSSEYLRPIFVPRLKNDWVLIIDPDEIVMPKLKIEILELFSKVKINSNISNVVVPWRFYFGQRPLKGTPWGGTNSKTLIVNRNNFYFVPQIHNGQRKAEGALEIKIGSMDDFSYLKHKWMINWNQFLEKHKRYLIAEGPARYENDKFPKIRSVLIAPFKEFIWAFLLKKGYKDGLLGLALCIFWTWYQTLATFKHLKTARLNRS
jgi:glycosyltransferase involved in cell wall biosynthesis